jgi:hypothetical protein
MRSGQYIAIRRSPLRRIAKGLFREANRGRPEKSHLPTTESLSQNPKTPVKKTLAEQLLKEILNKPPLF